MAANRVMTITEARRWVATMSFTAVLLHAGVLILAPAVLPLLNMVPLRWADALRLLEVVCPVFFSFLALAAMYATHGTGPVPQRLPAEQMRLISLLLRGSILVFAALDVAGFTAFLVSNRPSATVETGLSIDDLSRILTLALTLLAGTTHVVVVWLFRVEKKVLGGASPAPAIAPEYDALSPGERS